MANKKDYEAIAKIMAENRPDGSPYIRAWEWLVYSLSLYFKSDNRRFDPARFRAACNAEVEQ